MGLMAVTLVLEGNEHKVVVDVGSKGVNKDIMNNEVLPKVIKHFNIDCELSSTSSFRYYLGQCIRKISVHTSSGEVLEGHLTTSKVMSSDILEI